MSIDQHSIVLNGGDLSCVFDTVSCFFQQLRLSSCFLTLFRDFSLFKLLGEITFSHPTSLVFFRYTDPVVIRYLLKSQHGKEKEEG